MTVSVHPCMRVASPCVGSRPYCADSTAHPQSLTLGWSLPVPLLDCAYSPPVAARAVAGLAVTALAVAGLAVAGLAVAGLAVAAAQLAAVWLGSCPHR